MRLKVVYAGRPHARIERIDPSAALAAPGVVAVLTAADVPYNAFGLIEHDQPVLCADRVRFAGDKVAVIVAETSDAAEAGAQLVAVTYEDLPAVTDPRDALALGRPARARDARFEYVDARPDPQRRRRGGVQGRGRRARREFATSWQEHAFPATRSRRRLRRRGGAGRHRDRRAMAARGSQADRPDAGIPEEQVVIRYAAIGGAFGGREDLSVQHLLALAAWKLQPRRHCLEPRGIDHRPPQATPFRIQCRWA